VEDGAAEVTCPVARSAKRQVFEGRTQGDALRNARASGFEAIGKDALSGRRHAEVQAGDLPAENSSSLSASSSAHCLRARRFTDGRSIEPRVDWAREPGCSIMNVSTEPRKWKQLWY
jgi:hypothetical protein